METQFNIVIGSFTVNLLSNSQKKVTSILDLQEVKGSILDKSGLSSLRHLKRSVCFVPTPTENELICDWFKRAQMSNFRPMCNITIDEQVTEDAKALVNEKLSQLVINSTSSDTAHCQQTDNIPSLLVIQLLKRENTALASKVCELNSHVDSMAVDLSHAQANIRDLSNRFTNQQVEINRLKEQSLLRDVANDGFFMFFLYKSSKHELTKRFVNEDQDFGFFEFKLPSFFKALNGNTDGSAQLKDMVLTFANQELSMDDFQMIRRLVIERNNHDTVHSLFSIEHFDFDLEAYLNAVRIKLSEMKHYRSIVQKIINAMASHLY